MECLQHLARRQDARTYLEIGVQGGRSFLPLRVPRKVGVDPVPLPLKERLKAARSYYPNAFSRMYVETSDAFFERHASRVFGRRGVDLVFVDGNHTHAQALRDVSNALLHLSSRGLIVVHDTNPDTATMAWPAETFEDAAKAHPPGWNGLWCGDVWRAIVRLRRDGEVGVRTLPNDRGVTVIDPRPGGERLADDPGSPDTLDFEDLDRNRELWLGLCDPDELDAWLDLDPVLARHASSATMERRSEPVA